MRPQFLEQPPFTRACASIALLAFLAAPASASVTAFTDITAFNAAVTGATTANFEGIAPANDIAFGDQLVDGVTFTANGAPFVIDVGATPNHGASFFSGQGNHDNVPANSVSVSLTGFNAVGFFYGSYINTSEPYSAMLSTGDVFNISNPANTSDLNFIGFVSDGAAIDSIIFTSIAGPNLNDGSTNYAYGYAFDITSFVLANPVAPVPLPAAAWLFGSGLFGLLAQRRRSVSWIKFSKNSK
jgi:hypothetical protein